MKIHSYPIAIIFLFLFLAGLAFHDNFNVISVGQNNLDAPQPFRAARSAAAAPINQPQAVSTPVPPQSERPHAMVPVRPVPTPPEPATVDAAGSSSLDGRFYLGWLLLLTGMGGLGLLAGSRWPRRRERPAKKGWRRALPAVLGLLLIGCQAEAIEPLPPDQYLDQALTWLEVNAVTADGVDWPAVRAEIETMVPDPQTTADTYPALEYALDQLEDPQAWLTTPEKSVWDGAGLGLVAVYPQNIVVTVQPDGPAGTAGVLPGDEVVLVNGRPPEPEDERPHTIKFQADPFAVEEISLRLARDGEEREVILTEAVFRWTSEPFGQSIPLGSHSAGYLDLRSNPGEQLYPTQFQALLAEIDGENTCGWLIDLRLTRGGNLWTYLAALYPFLGEGEPGGFVYADGRREGWALQDGQVFWGAEKREESYIRGRHHRLAQPNPPVALLLGPLTEGAGELVAVAFKGWGSVRTFGQPTLGVPNLVQHTPLSDEAHLFVSGANGYDRAGTVYNGPIVPDELVAVDWSQLGTPDDPLAAAALAWLAEQPACAS